MSVPSIKDYLQAKVLPNYVFTDSAILAALMPEPSIGKQGVSDASLPATSVLEKERDLAEAVLWDMAAGLVNGGGMRKSFGNRSWTDMSIQTSQQDRTTWQTKAKSLRAKWGVESEIDNIPEIRDYTHFWK